MTAVGLLEAVQAAGDPVAAGATAGGAAVAVILAVERVLRAVRPTPPVTFGEQDRAILQDLRAGVQALTELMRAAVGRGKL